MTVYGCHNRAHLRAFFDVQDGWNDNGTRRMVTVPIRSNPDCQYDNKATDKKCLGCRWGERNG